MKPGPKIGSLQKQRKGQKFNETAQSRWSSSYSRPPDGPIINPQDDDFDILNGRLEKKALVPAVPADMTVTARTETREDSQQRASHSNTLDLAFILHPSHEVTTSDQAQKLSPSSQDSGQAGLCRQACTELGISQVTMNQIIRVFFDNMVAINIFHEPSFTEKISNISSLAQLCALLAAMAGYASRFSCLKTDVVTSGPVHHVMTSHRQPAYFIDLTFKYINNALVECDDEMPPLCVLQALIVATHCRLTQGVRGKAWRSLGLCVSLVYEAKLHILDSRKVVKKENPHRWQEDEEKRRVFWAVWEMDIFASTIRRTPTAIDQNQIEILLPVDNTHWFSGDPTSSCFMETDPNQRWKALQESGSQSPKAWFLIINSLMKDAQIVCNPQAVSTMGNRDHHKPKSNNWASTPEPALEAHQKLETLANAVRCFSLALPSHLHYRDQYLAFGAPAQEQLESQRQQHCSIYNIFVMTQLACLMIYRYDAFGSQSRRPEISGRHRSGNTAGRGTFSPFNSEIGALSQYYEAADRILEIVNRSCEDHFQHINPFLSSTIWLASAVQLVRKHFARANSNRDLIKSRFDVLYLTYKQCVHFWDIQTALERNLEFIEEQLEARYKRPETQACPSFQEASKRASRYIKMINQSSSDREGHHIERDAKRVWTSPQASQYPPETPSVPLTSSVSIDDGLDMTAQNYVQQPPGVADNVAMLDIMTFPQPNSNHISEDYMMPTNSDFLDSLYLGNFQLDEAFDWPIFDFPGGIHDILAGRSTY